MPAPRVPTAESRRDEQREKVIVRSNGTVTYVGKDIAYQFWKFGLLGRDFHYQRFTTCPDSTTLGYHQPRRRPSRRTRLWRRQATYNVIDARQSYLQKLSRRRWPPSGSRRSRHSIHFSYEMVALSHETARELGFAPPPEARRRSGRSSRCRAARASA